MNVKFENFIGIFEDAFSKEYCDTAIKYFDEMETAGLTLTRQQQHNDVPKLSVEDTQLHASDEVSIRQSGYLIGQFNNIFWGQAYPQYLNKFEILKSASTHGTYAFKMQKTCIGQGYHLWHCENTTRSNSSRLLVWSLYLNDVEEGGETEFLYYPKRIKPKAGTLLIWPAGFQHAHRGNPPISNTKYIVTGWLEF